MVLSKHGLNSKAAPDLLSKFQLYHSWICIKISVITIDVIDLVPSILDYNATYHCAALHWLCPHPVECHPDLSTSSPFHAQLVLLEPSASAHASARDGAGDAGLPRLLLLLFLKCSKLIYIKSTFLFWIYLLPNIETWPFKTWRGIFS